MVWSPYLNVEVLRLFCTLIWKQSGVGVQINRVRWKNNKVICFWNSLSALSTGWKCTCCVWHFEFKKQPHHVILQCEIILNGQFQYFAIQHIWYFGACCVKPKIIVLDLIYIVSVWWQLWKQSITYMSCSYCVHPPSPDLFDTIRACVWFEEPYTARVGEQRYTKHLLDGFITEPARHTPCRWRSACLCFIKWQLLVFGFYLPTQVLSYLGELLS